MKKSKQSLPDVSLVGTEAPKDGWKPPEGSWEDHIQSVETVEKDDDDNLWAYVIWNHRTSEGKFLRSRHPADKGERSCYEKCPKKVRLELSVLRSVWSRRNLLIWENRCFNSINDICKPLDILTYILSLY